MYERWIYNKLKLKLVCHLDKTACGHFKKNRLGDYRIIITSSATNQRRGFSIITHVIILKAFKDKGRDAFGQKFRKFRSRIKRNSLFRNVYFENFGQSLEVCHFSEILEIPEISWGAIHLWKKFGIFRSESNGTVIYGNFGQPLKVDHFFRNVGITGKFLFHLTAGKNLRTIWIWSMKCFLHVIQ